MPIHYDTIEDGQNKKFHLLFSKYNNKKCNSDYTNLLKAAIANVTIGDVAGEVHLIWVEQVEQVANLISTIYTLDNDTLFQQNDTILFQSVITFCPNASSNILLFTPMGKYTQL